MASGEVEKGGGGGEKGRSSLEGKQGRTIYDKDSFSQPFRNGGRWLGRHSCQQPVVKAQTGGVGMGGGPCIQGWVQSISESLS